MKTYEDARLKARRFCQERSWSKFHEPRSLVLALAGEVGELSEIFQWKGNLPDGLDSSFGSKDVIHVGEECSDVFIYSTRLCDVCNINLSKAVKFCLLHKERALEVAAENETEFKCTETEMWSDINFKYIESEVATNYPSLTSTRNPRDISLNINTHLGSLCNVFQNRQELDTLPGLPSWSRGELSTLAISVAHICILLSWLCSVCKLQLNSCVSDKFSKNDKKYPVHLVKGSSAKYTAYSDEISKQSSLSNGILAGTVLIFSGVVASAFVLLKNKQFF